MDNLNEKDFLTGLLAILNYESEYKVLEEEEDGKRDKRRKS